MIEMTVESAKKSLMELSMTLLTKAQVSGKSYKEAMAIVGDACLELGTYLKKEGREAVEQGRCSKCGERTEGRPHFCPVPG